MSYLSVFGVHFFISFSIVFVVGLFVGLFASTVDGARLAGMAEGRIQVASGEYICELVEQPDKTNEWECIRT